MLDKTAWLRISPLQRDDMQALTAGGSATGGPP
jgi:hypothetical protein